MTDYTELKRLAEDVGSDLWHAAHARSGGRGWEVVQGVDQVADGMTEARARFIAAANPAAILALIAENERIKQRLCACKDCGGQGEVYSGHSTYQGYNQPPEPDMDVCGTCGGDGVLGSLEDFESLATERDQLKAEVEALRVDAERYRALRAATAEKIGISSLFIFDAMVDAAMSKEVGHD